MGSGSDRVVGGAAGTVAAPRPPGARSAAAARHRPALPKNTAAKFGKRRCCHPHLRCQGCLTLLQTGAGRGGEESWSRDRAPKEVRASVFYA